MLCEFFHEQLEYQENLLLKYYRKHGFDVTVLTSTIDSVFDYYSDKHDVNKPTREYFFNGARIVKIQYEYVRLKNRLRKYKDITWILEEEQPNLIYVHDIMLNFHEAIRYVKRHPECKMIMDYHADYSNSAKHWLSLQVLHGIIRRRFYLDPARKFLSKIFPIVPAGFKFLNEVYKVPWSEMELLPLGGDYDLAKQISSTVDRVALRRKLGIPSNAFVIFTGGKLEPRKKTQILISAVNRLARNDIHLLIAGKADSEQYGTVLAETAADSPQIHFLGWLNTHDIYTHMAIADAAIFPASQSILWQQSICMHMPLVVGDTGGQSVDYLNPYSNIITLERSEISEERFAEVILELQRDPCKTKQMREGAAKTACELLDWNKLIYKTLQFNAPIRTSR